jgi:hypothetical protein
MPGVCRASRPSSRPLGSTTKPSVDDASLLMVFMSNCPGGAGGMDLYTSTRPTPFDAWGAPVNLTDVNAAADERGPLLAAQNLQLFWAANATRLAIAFGVWRHS